MTARILLALVVSFIIGCDVHAGSTGAAIPVLVDLQRDAMQAERERKPLILLFTLPGCAFCHVVRNNYLAPLLRTAAPKDRPIIREIDITSTQNFSTFKGNVTTHQSLARDLNIRVAPTVLFLDPSGRLLAEPIVGGDTAGFYGAYLENAFVQAAEKLSAARQTNSRGDQP